MVKSILQNSKRLTTPAKLLIAIVTIGTLAIATTPVYSHYTHNAKAAEAAQTLSAIITYVNSYNRAHTIQQPLEGCDTTELNEEWIDTLVSYTSYGADEHFKFVYVNGNNPHVLAEGYASNNSFNTQDKLIFYFSNNTWKATGKLQDVKPS